MTRWGVLAYVLILSAALTAFDVYYKVSHDIHVNAALIGNRSPEFIDIDKYNMNYKREVIDSVSL